MVSHYGRPKRKDPTHARVRREPERRQSSENRRDHGGASREALDVASYVSDMAAQLEAMSLAAGLDLLGYFLGMARSEADLFVRTNAGPEGAAEDDKDDDGLSGEDQADFDSSES
jgi:hypothetical protein